MDDEPAITQLITFALQSQFELRVCSSARDALALVPGWRPRIILCDANLPDMNGYDFTEAIRARPGPGTIPVILMTGEATDESEKRAQAAGATAFLEKPFPISLLRTTITQALGPGVSCP